MSKKYIWALDISLKNTGIAIYDLEKGEFVYISSFSTEKIRATKEYKGLYVNGVKLKKIVDWLKEIMKVFPPKHIAIERGFSRFNTETQVLFRCHGVINCLLWQVPQEYYTPKTIKAEILHGDASKDDVRKQILSVYPNLEITNEDESDAVAILLTYLIKEGLIKYEKPEKPIKKKKKKVVKDVVESEDGEVEIDEKTLNLVKAMKDN
ncbi:RuvC-like Holliday junction resolvase [Bacillus phage vB_BcoS-136]|uniref:Holliday junction resolvase n=1 Tax=Bacillus phage vB_BcoS-136 TaxID=2419619 RepID=A0A3G3BVJ8_9CAUD|nr:RuvC-like Holliday junction resolvase [Bacillus phage vB_BcoS-136]AYP68278.1 holliday junction resolvase [Bacillus phage vB_BcoS-136]